MTDTKNHDYFQTRYPNITTISHSGVRNEERFCANKVIKSVVFPAAAQAYPPYTLLPDPLPSESQVVNGFKSYGGIVDELGFYFVERAKILGRGMIVKDDCRLYGLDIIPDYVESEIERKLRPELAVDAGQKAPIELTGTYVHLMSEAYPIYGHWLLDIIPKAWLYMTQFGEHVPDSKFLYCSDTPQYGLDIISILFDISRDQIKFYDFETEIPIIERLILPSLMHNSHVYHPAMKRSIRFVLEKIIPGFTVHTEARKPYKKIYVSRDRFRDRSISTKRRIANEEDLLKIVLAKGFEVIYPEELGWSEQVDLFSRSSIVVGEAGSGLHNTIFSPSSAHVVAICQGTQVQGTLAALLGQKLTVLGADEISMIDGEMSFFIDPARFEYAVDTALLNSSAE